jgi:hypothetical protein
MISTIELGTDPARLETELQKVLDIAHAWVCGAPSQLRNITLY